MKWRHIKDEQPEADQSVLVWNAEMAASDKRHDSKSHGIRLGRWIPSLDELRPDGSFGFNSEWWMPLPAPPNV